MRPTTFKVDNTVYWTIRTYTDAGVLVDADSTPSVAVRKNGSSVADSVTVTKRAATTGIYDCSYNPAGEAEGDCFTIEESATVSAQAYENSWSLEALAAERGTDGANTVAPDNAGISAILDDTNELQSNQGNWLTATNVVASNMRGTDNASTFDHTSDEVITDSASREASKATVTGLALEATSQDILADTNELQGNQGDWATATTVVASNMRGTDGASTFAHTTDEVSTDSASREASKATVTGLALEATSQDILADTNELQSNQGNWLTATTTISSNMRGTDNALLATSAPANWSIMSVNGSGAITTSNPASGGGSAHTAQDVVDLLLVTPSNKLATDASGNVEASNMRGTDGANTVAPATPANVTAAQNAIETRLDAVDTDNSAIKSVVDSNAVNVLQIISDVGDVDTNVNTLISNQGDWATATGFATPANLTAAVAPLLTEATYTSSLPSNFSSFAITAAGLVTSTNGGGGGGDATLANQTAIIDAIGALNDFDPAGDVVANVTLVDTTTDLTNGGSGLQEGVDYVWTNVATGNSDTVRITQ